MTPTRKRLELADLTARERQLLDTAFHESGHSIAAVALGGSLHAAVVVESKTFGIHGSTVVTAYPEGRTAAIAYAGCWAQARWGAGRRPTQRELHRLFDTTGCKDFKMLQASGATLSDGSPVSALLERCWPAVVTVAKKLWCEGEARHEDVCSALSIPTRDNGHHLSLIRSGSVPGTFTVSPAVT